MYYKLRQDVLFRQYDEYGLITDNSEYGYRMLNDMKRPRGEKYVSNRERNAGLSLLNLFWQS